MKITNRLCVGLAGTIALFVSACSPAGGPSAGTEADQSVSTSHQRTQQWAREDLLSKSTTGNIQMPAPGLIIQALAELNETTLPPVPPHGEDLPTFVAAVAADGATDSDLQLISGKLLFPTVASLEKSHYVEPPATLAKGLSAMLASLSKSKDPAKQYQAMVGPVTAAVLWPVVRTGDIAAAPAAIIHARIVLSAAAWCRTAAQVQGGWPVRWSIEYENSPIQVPAWMRKEASADAHISPSAENAFYWYVAEVQRTTMSCANLVAKIATSIGPIAYTDQGSLKTAIYERLVAFTSAELAAMQAPADGRGFAVDMSSNGAKGQAFQTNEGRFENLGSGWTWKRGNVVYLDGANVYGRAVTVSLASAATGTMRQVITGNQSLAASAVERAKAAMQAGPPK